MDVVLRLGMRGPLVREAQGLINSYFGSLKLKPDSRFGPTTEAVIKEFQKSMKLDPDGVIGQRTWGALRSRGRPVGPSPAGFDPFDMRTLEVFFESLRQQVAATWGGSRAAASSGTGRAVTPPPPVAPPTAAAKPAASNAAPAGVPKVVSVEDFKRYSRTTFEGYAGRAYVIKDFMKFENYGIQVAGKLRVVGPKDEWSGLKNECAQLVQYFGVPHSSKWRRGPRVCDFKVGELARGTVIATLRDNKYYSDYSGRSHVGIYLSHTDYQEWIKTRDKAGHVSMLDQFNGAPIARRERTYFTEADDEGSKAKKQWTDSQGKVRDRRVKWMQDGEEDYVLLTTE